MVGWCRGRQGGIVSRKTRWDGAEENMVGWRREDMVGWHQGRHGKLASRKMRKTWWAGVEEDTVG